MRIRRTLSALVVAGLAAGGGLALAPAASAAPGTSSLAALLASDGDTFDRSWYDFDILDQAVAAVLAGWWPLTTTGIVLTLASGVFTLIMADLQYLGLRRMRA